MKIGVMGGTALVGQSWCPSSPVTATNCHGISGAFASQGMA